MKWLFSFMILSILAYVSPTYAYIIAVPANQPALKYNEPTRILIPGRGTDLALLPQMTALSRAAVYLRSFPKDQIIMISVIENDYNEDILKAAGWKLIVNNDVILETKTVLAEVTKFSAIQSFEMFAHSGPIRGFQMDGDSHVAIRFDPREPEVAQLRSHFAPGAYAILSGCNSGWSMAQNLAKQWNIAVAGTFTESQFELLHSNGQYYVGASKFAPNSRWADENPTLGTACGLGGCTRMRPNNRSYVGWWGNFDGPLIGHFKFFCPLSVKECEKRMAYSLYGFLAEKPLQADSNLDDFRAVAMEYLCPVSKNRKTTNECYKKLALLETDKGDKKIFFTEGNEQLSCDLRGCKAKIECDLPNHHCLVTERVSQNSTTLADEYLHLINGFKAIVAEGI
ncbi:MAG: hypothetical protein IT287_04580 [Bdellovibrionaceae bacterium]|nr:hypothetical protein [Pseudobdellovibrionaceae bacterium]